MSEELKTDELFEVSDIGPEEVNHEPYRALVELSYEGKTISVGEIIENLPSKSLGWLLEGNYIEKVN